jgi:DnaA family protein
MGLARLASDALNREVNTLNRPHETVLPQQSTLNVRLPVQATFANYYPGDNGQVVHKLMHYLSHSGQTTGCGVETLTYLWGAPGVGRTHLLQAIGHQASLLDQPSVYLPLRDYGQLTPDALMGLETLPLICLDDIDAIAGQIQWEEALFHLYNRLYDTPHRLIVTASCSPNEIQIQLPDLKSRLMSGIPFHLQALSDEQKSQALICQAKSRGMSLSQDVAQFLIRRLSRDMGALLSQLEILDQASLTAKHTLTLPFVRKVLQL